MNLLNTNWTDSMESHNINSRNNNNNKKVSIPWSIAWHFSQNATVTVATFSLDGHECFDPHVSRKQFSVFDSKSHSLDIDMEEHSEIV